METYKKDKIIECVLKGGLKSRTQRYKIEYLYPDIDYTAKISIAHRIEESINDTIRMNSLRFEQSNNLLDFIGHCIRAYLYFKKKTNEFNLEHEKYKIQKMIEYHIKKEMEDVNN